MIDLAQILDFLKASPLSWVSFSIVAISAICNAIVAIVQIVKLKKYNSEVDMKYRSGNDYSVTTNGQKFSRTKPEYELNERTNELELTGEETDIQKQIDSYLDSCLEATLKRLLDQTYEDKKQFGEREALRDKLEELQESIEASYDTAEFLRKKLGYAADLDPTEIFDKALAQFEAEERAEKLKSKKEVNENATPQDETAKQS